MIKQNFYNINMFIVLAKRKIIEIKENGEVNMLISGKYKKNVKKNIAYAMPHGYRMVRIKYEGKYLQSYAHRIIWTYFKGRIPEGYTINHIDGKRDNNDIRNLELATSKEQKFHAIHITKTASDMKGENNINRKITMQDARMIRVLRRKKKKLREVKEELNLDLSLRQISKITRKENWKEEDGKEN